ncbi:GNAT family N-acetyltransferase [Roseibium sp. MMSF_3544]|uniref:GNAT family N-acetyltransferase n=1 Tax=unclassified Roseibium TaxID=2629323 RepID=UPI00273E4A39|nr:GNAT family N-acetyltransferase [Roseibium sp. MMSF_3544]
MIGHAVLLERAQAKLDRPIWFALTSRQADIAISAGSARAYPTDIAPFAASDPEDETDHAGLARLTQIRADGVHLLQANDVHVPKGLVCTLKVPSVQMVLERQLGTPDTAEVVRLTKPDVNDMRHLVNLTRPGPFASRTLSLGPYWGIRHRGQLIAMAGERMRLSGYCEISAVCVHPNHRRRGLARRLVSVVAAGIYARAETPFLHTFANNESAIALYHDMGFRLRRQMHIAALMAA